MDVSLVKAADIPEITENDVIITSARHYEDALLCCKYSGRGRTLCVCRLRSADAAADPELAE